jgi:hypothetical protein
MISFLEKFSDCWQMIYWPMLLVNFISDIVASAAPRVDTVVPLFGKCTMVYPRVA